MKNKSCIYLNMEAGLLDLKPYIGQYIKVFTQDQEWFIGELLKVMSHENDKYLEFEFDIISSSKDRKRSDGNFNEIDRDKNKYTGIHILKANEVLDIEELDPKVQQGIKLTISNVPNILDAFRSMNTGNLPKKIEFGKIEEPE